MADEERPFLSRWSQRKAQARGGAVPAEPVPVVPEVLTAPVAPSVAAATASEPQVEPVALPPPPTMDDVAELTHASDYSRFVAPGVDSGVSNAAMRKLFSDPHFNVMDGLDIYIGDYSQPDPIPPDMLRKMVQSKFLGLFDEEEKEEARLAAEAAQPAAPPKLAEGNTSAADNPAHDDHTDLQLQPDDAARRAGADQGAGPREV